MFNFTLKTCKNAFGGRFCPDPLGSLQRFRRPVKWIMGDGPSVGKMKGQGSKPMGRKEGRRGAKGGGGDIGRGRAEGEGVGKEGKGDNGLQHL